MDYREEYKRKLRTPKAAVQCVKSGNWVDYTVALGFPTLLDAALAARKEELTDVKIRGNLMFGPIKTVECDPTREHFIYNSWHCSGYERKLRDRDLCNYIPMVFRDVVPYYRHFLTVNSNEPEFVQTVEEVLTSLEPIISLHPEYEKADLLNRMVEPERMFTFRVCWMADDGTWHTNTGWRCQFNGAIGPYKGGLRFQPNVTPGTIKFLGFEQTFKNSLTGLPIGGGKGGSDSDPSGKSDAEIMRFCQSFMQALYRYIGPDVDVPAGDMGVGAREIGYLYGEYRRMKGVFENGVLTGKGFSYGGSLIRPEAPGYGAVYYLENVLKHEGESIEGKTIACAGFGNVTWGICKKAAQLGAKVVTLSGPDGYIYDPDGVVTEEKINYLLEMRASGRNRVQDYADNFPSAEFFPGEKPWGVKVDICMPSAI